MSATDDPREDSATAVALGLEDAQATTAALWRQHTDDDMRKRSLRALRALIAAEATMKAADAFLLAKTPAERKRTFEALKAAACLRVGHDIRSYP